MHLYVDPVPALKAQLAREIVARLDRPGALITATFTVIGAPELSHLRRSRLDRFSVQGLMRTLVRLGYEVEVILTQPEQVRQREREAIARQRREALLATSRRRRGS